MKATVKQIFIDKKTKKRYKPGEVIEVTEERAKEILKKLPKAIEVAKEEKPKKAKKKAE